MAVLCWMTTVTVDLSPASIGLGVSVMEGEREGSTTSAIEFGFVVADEKFGVV